MLRVEVRELFLSRREYIEGLRAYRFLESGSKRLEIVQENEVVVDGEERKKLDEVGGKPC